MSSPAGGWRTRTHAEFATRLGEVLGAKTAKQFEQLKVRTVGDLLRHVPRRYLSGTELSDLSQLTPGEDVAVLARVQRSRPVGHGRKMRLEAVITDGQGHLQLTFFGRDHLVNWWASQLVEGRRGIFVGKVGEFQGRPQLTHPDFVLLGDDGTIIASAKQAKEKEQMAKVYQTGGLIGLYPATRQLPTWRVAECIQLVLDGLGEVADPLPDWIRDEAELVDLHTALQQVHRPTDREQVESGLERLRFDEALAMQLTMAYRRADLAAHGATPRKRIADGILTAFDARLPFELTDGQQQVSAEIFTDLAEPAPMQRLLQGEVGSGKTMVALRAMLAVIDSGGQSVLLAPTEVLATQHHQTITSQLGDLSEGGTLAAAEHATGVVLLTGSMSTAQKRAALLKIASGEAGLVIGTHALLADQVQFADLGLVVVDEQHRFGVEQRAALNAKASARPHLLVMTATPIPRSVAMTVFGDLEVSTLTEIPAGRAEVQTVVVDAQRQPVWVDRAWDRIVEEAGQGRQAFVVCARISESDKSAESVSAESVPTGEETAQAVTVVDQYELLRAGPLADLRVEMLHGQLPTEEKDEVMGRFAAGAVDVLVATTVVEVGVDVPNASVMVIMDADRFGISQLHQLRGRIGRGEHPGVCLLLTLAEEDTPARQRLDAVAATRDGFRLAEVDLEQRREGDVTGSSQSGTRSGLRLVRVLAHAEVIAIARDLAERAVLKDPDRTDPGLADMVDQIELLAAGEWLERN
ncbi:MAG: ATP-dependent DNA helicase RecG [Propionibacteriaceae bacterium]